MVTTSEIIVDLSNYPYKQLRNQYGAHNLDKINFNFDSYILQRKINIDRAINMNFALVVHNFINQEIYAISQAKNKSKIDIYELKKKKDNLKEGNIQNGSIVKLIIDPWVPYKIEKDSILAKTSPIYFNVTQKYDSKEWELTIK